MNKHNMNKITIRLIIAIGLVMGACQPMRAADMAPIQTESEQRATQQEMIAQTLQTGESVPAHTTQQGLLNQEQAISESVAKSESASSIVQDRMKMVLVLKIRERIVANKALKQSVLAHDQKIAELEQKIEKKNQTWFDWAASLFKDTMPKELRSLQDLEAELAAATAGNLVGSENPEKFDLRFLAMALKKQVQYETQLKAIIDKQKQQINKLEAILENS